MGVFDIMVLPLLAVAMTSAPPAITAQDTRIAVDIPASSLDAALLELARQSNSRILFASDLVTGRRAAALRGRLTVADALDSLLAGSPLLAQQTGRGTFVVVAAQRVQPRTGQPTARQPAVRRSSTARPPAVSQASEAEPNDVVVTGSNLRGAVGSVTPVVTLDRGEIERSGRSNVAAALALLPQNFGGTGNEETSLTGADRVVENVALASSVNLRGLGSDATLTLINGRRSAGSGGKGDFTDLSTIPLAAVERIEVLADGASAIYGSDAVGGVVHVILRQRFAGAETRMRASTVTSGGMQNYQFGQVAGTSWQTGHILGAYEFDLREALASESRLATRSADLRPLGGKDFRSYFSRPATVLVFDPVSGAYVPGFAVPAGQNGTGLAPASFRPGQNLSNQRAGSDVLPRQRRHSSYLRIEQDVTSSLKIDVEARAADRRFSYRGSSDVGFISVGRNNPFFVSPDGTPSTILAYSFADELGPTRARGHVQALSVAGGVRWDTLAGWRIDAYGSFARETASNSTAGLVNQAYLAEALGNIPDNAATSYDARRDGYFNPFGALAENPATILDFIGAGETRQRVVSRVATVNVQAEGALIDLPGGEVRLAIGGQHRSEDFQREGSSFLFAVSPTPLATIDGDRGVDAVFGELAIPLVGRGNARPGLAGLDLSLAARHERYSDFGSTTNPKAGVRYRPSEDITVYASWGRSFRSPALRELAEQGRVSATQLPSATGPTLVLYLTGGNASLKPETATSQNFGITLAPTKRKGTNVTFSYFATDFKNRIGQPVYQNILQTLLDPTLASFVQRIAPQTNAQDRAQAQALISSEGSLVPAGLPPELFGAIIDGRYVNSASVVVRGVDFAARTTLPLGAGMASLAASASYFIDYRDRVTAVANEVERVATVGYPARFRASSSVGWNSSRWATTLAAQYVSRMRDEISRPARSVSDWLTFDLQISRTFGDATPLLRGASLALSITNLFDAEPPFVNSAAGIGYDPTNANVLGRQAALQLIKRW